MISKLKPIIQRYRLMVLIHSILDVPDDIDVHQNYFIEYSNV